MKHPKIKKILESRSSWTVKDYEEAYGDVWDEIPSSLKECQSRMEEYICNTYDDDLLDEILNGELETYMNGDNDQPTTCPKCGSRTEFIDLSENKQQHKCYGCNFVFNLLINNK